MMGDENEAVFWNLLEVFLVDSEAARRVTVHTMLDPDDEGLKHSSQYPPGT